MVSLRVRWSNLCVRGMSLEVLCLALCFSLNVQLQAQGTGGRILGRVGDPSGAVLGKVKVSATNDATGVGHDALTNDSGDYVFPDLPVGTYSNCAFFVRRSESLGTGMRQVIDQLYTTR